MAPKVRGRQGAASGAPITTDEMVVAAARGDGDASSNATASKPRTRGSSEPRTPLQPTPQQQEQRFGKRGSGQAFALGLFQILKTEDPTIIGWSASGKAFRIGDSEKFCKDIMPRFFKQNKYSSFQRQLNLYGFRKLVRGNEAGGYMHPLFERGKPEQLSQVRRGFFPEIPPEFAHDVHGHGLNDPQQADSSSNGVNATASRAAPRGRKSEGGRPSTGAVGGGGGGGGAGHERSASVGRSGSGSLAPAAAAAAAAVAAAAAGAAGAPRGLMIGKGIGGPGRRAGHDQGHVRSGSGPVMMAHGGVGGQGLGLVGGDMAMDTDWDGAGGPLPSLDMVTGGLRKLHGRHANGGGQGAGAEMPPTLGRLVPCADNVVSRESSPLKGSGGGGGGGRMHPTSTSSLRTDRHDGYHMPYGRSQDDLNLSPRSHYGPPPIMGMGSHVGLGNWAAGGGLDSASGYYNQSANRGQGPEILASTGSGNSSQASRRSPRPLQHMHSRDDLDALRPRKTRRTGPSFHSNHDDDPSQSFLAVSPRRDGDGSEAGFVGEGYLNTGGMYAGPDEIPPAAPRRLVSRHNTPSRPERSGAAKGGGSGSSGGSGEGEEVSRRHTMHLADPNTIDTEGVVGGGPGGMGVSQGYNLAAHGFYAAMSPVTVGAARGGFAGGRRHQRHNSSGNQQGSGGAVTPADGGLHRASPGWRLGEVSPEEAAVMRGDSPSSSRSGGGGGGGAVGGMGVGGLGLTAHAMSRMEQVKVSRNGVAGTGNGTQGVQALGENLSQLDLSEARRERSRQQGGGGDGDNNGGNMSQGGYDANGQPRQSQQGPQHHHRRALPHYTQPLRDEIEGGRDGSAGGSGGHKRHVSDGPGGSKGSSEEWVPGRRPTAAEAAELLRRRSSVDEVIGLLSAPTADGGFEDEGVRPQQFDPAQFDSWRNSLTKVLGHLGFDFEDEQGVPHGPEGKRSPAKRVPGRGTSQYLSWGGTSAMSFEEQPEEFHESLRQIPMRWRSSLSSIMTSMASNGAWGEDGAGAGGEGAAGAAVDMDVAGDGKSGGAGGERKRLEQQASLEMLQSVMRETLESMSGGGDTGDAEDGEEEAKAAAAAALAMGSMCRANANGGSGAASSATAAPGAGGTVNALGSNTNNGSPRAGRGYVGPPVTSGAMRDSSSRSAVVISSGAARHERRPSLAPTDAYAYNMRKGPGAPYALAAGNGNGGSLKQEHHTSF